MISVLELNTTNNGIKIARSIIGNKCFFDSECTQKTTLLGITAFGFLVESNLDSKPMYWSRELFFKLDVDLYFNPFSLMEENIAIVYDEDVYGVDSIQNEGLEGFTIWLNNGDDKCRELTTHDFFYPNIWIDNYLYEFKILELDEEYE